ncbi:DUF7563 family protein [Halomicrobium mukohataei]|uniref:DUF7563 family protein n=1 Tax=Halomicrobium mukohataei TaxID=57705 RepID=UPI0014760768
MVRVIRLPESRIDKTTCQHCGTHVSRDFRRTFGDEDDIAHRCAACDCMARLSAGSAAGKSVSKADPADHPNRNRGQRTKARTDGGDSW